jgi:hypothetical protein
MRRKLLSTLRMSIATLFVLFATGVAPTAAVFANGNSNNNGQNNQNNNGNTGGGNENCPAGTTEIAKYNFVGGSYVAESGGSAVSIGAGSTSTAGTYTVASTNTTITTVIVKGSDDAKQVSVTGQSGSFNNSGLTNNGNQTPAISNIKFCGNTVQPTQVTPLAPAKDDKCGTANDTFSVTAVTGVVYKVGGVTVSGSGNSTGGASSVTVTPEALNSSYTLTSSTPFVLTFTNYDCPPPPEEDKTSLCHATGSESNPYVFIENISVSGAFNGHLDDGSGGTNGDHQNGEDIIPPFEYKGQTYSQNWNSVGQAIYRAECKVTPPEKGSITIIKDAQPDSAFSFGFTSNVNGHGSFNLVDNPGFVGHNNDETMTGLALEETYTFTENATTGWTLGNINCGNANVTKDGRSVSVKLTANQKDVTCTFVNTQNQDTPEGGRGGGETVMQIITVAAAKPVVTPAAPVGGQGAGEELIDTGSNALLSLFVGLTIFGLTAGVAFATPRRRYS